MRLVLFLASLSVSVLASGPGHGQQSPQTYTPQTYAPQTWSPLTHSPQTHSPQTWTPQSGDNQEPSKKPRRRMVKCMRSDEPDDYCVFYSYRDFRRGSPCSCDGSRGSTN